MTYLTEDPWPLAFAFGVTSLALIWHSLRTGNKKVLRWAGASAICMLVPFVVDRLVSTDREQIRESLDGLSRAVIDGDAERAVRFVDKAEAPDNPTRKLIEQGLQQVDVTEDMHIKGVVIRVNGDSATCDFRANGTVALRGVTTRHVATRWLLQWEHRPDGWKIIKVTRLDPVSGDEIGAWPGS